MKAVTAVLHDLGSVSSHSSLLKSEVNRDESLSTSLNLELKVSVWKEVV